MKAGFHSPGAAAMVRPHSRGTDFALPDIFDEVEEDLRAERARSFGRRYGGLGVLGVVVVLAGTGAYVWWGQQQAAQTEAVAARFISATQQADKAVRPLGGIDQAQASQASSTFADIAAHGPAGYAVLAQLRLAALQWRTGQKSQAIASWQSVTNNGDAPKLLRDLATLTSAQHQVDSADPVLLKQSVETLTAQDNPWRPMAEEVVALIDLRQGKTHEAAEILQRLMIDPTAPEGIRQMVSDLVTTLPPEATKPVVAPAPPAPTPTTSPAPAKPASHG